MAGIKETMASFEARPASPAEERELEDGPSAAEGKPEGAESLRERHRAAMADAEREERGYDPELDEPPQDRQGRPIADADGPPPWAPMPPGVAAPRGVQVVFVRMRARLTAKPEAGDRWCALWPLSYGDEQLAAQRARGDANRMFDELVMATIRVVDGHPANWTGRREGAVRAFWAEIGPAYRKELKGIHARMHALMPEDRRDFFVNCVAVATSGG